MQCSLVSLLYLYTSGMDNTDAVSTSSEANEFAAPAVVPTVPRPPHPRTAGQLDLLDGQHGVCRLRCRVAADLQDLQRIVPRVWKEKKIGRAAFLGWQLDRKIGANSSMEMRGLKDASSTATVILWEMKSSHSLKGCYFILHFSSIPSCFLFPKASLIRQRVTIT